MQVELLSESNVKEIAAKFRELKIPCDAIYLDIDYMEGFRCFTWNKEYSIQKNG
jgi:alpha-glucosidase